MPRLHTRKQEGSGTKRNYSVRKLAFLAVASCYCISSFGQWKSTDVAPRQLADDAQNQTEPSHNVVDEQVRVAPTPPPSTISPTLPISSTSLLPKMPKRPKFKGFGGCLLVLEDSIRLTEWIAYHYAMLPLSRLTIALDPKNSPKSIQKIVELQERWYPFGLDIQLWYNDSYVERQDIREWLLGLRGGRNPQTTIKGPDHHDERQCQFWSACMRDHKINGQSWVYLSDSDEYLTYNYVHQDENASGYEDILLAWKPKEKMDEERALAMPFRQTLPSIDISKNKDNINNKILTYLDNQTFPACMRVPCLYFGIDESTDEEIQRDIPAEIDARKFSTLRYRKYQARRPGDFSKAMVDVSRINMEYLVRNQCHYQPNPVYDVCGYNGLYESGTDYMSSIFRLNHYHGSWEAFEERSSDFRGDRAAFYQKRLGLYGPFTTDLGDDDLRPWIHHLIHRVGGNIETAKALLTPPNKTDENSSNVEPQ